MATETVTTLAARVRAVAMEPPLSDLSAGDRDELAYEVAQVEALEDLPGRWQAAILAAESGTGGAHAAPGGHCCHHH